jgi:hypothetical protein
MLKDIFKVLQFFIKHPRSFMNVNLWARQELMRNELTLLADKMGSDKGLKKHLFTRVYGDLFVDKRSQIESILEIGLLCHSDQNVIGGREFSTVPSLDMWSKYFPSAKVYGFDDKDFSSARGDWEKIFRGDQSKREDLEKISIIQDSYDFIIDDALHASYHQQITFSCLFGLVKPGGIFIIEDLHFQPEWAEKEFPAEKTVTLLEKLQITGKWESAVSTAAEKSMIESCVESISFYDSMSKGISGSKALAVIKKKAS